VLKKSPKTGKAPIQFEIETKKSNENNTKDISVYGRNDDFRLFQHNPPKAVIHFTRRASFSSRPNQGAGGWKQDCAKGSGAVMQT
jgi:hypothetical protein